MEKDYFERNLENYEDVFADIINVLLFRGRGRIRERDLVSGMTHDGYTVRGAFLEQERDVKKYWMNGPGRICALFGLENQTVEDGLFPVREITYDGAEYRRQIRKRSDIRRENTRRRSRGEKPLAVPPIYPVVTLVLSFGNSRWKGPRHLKKCMDIPDGLEAHVSDYRLRVIEIAYLPEWQVKQFQSDFRYIAEYFVGNRMLKEGRHPSFHFPMNEIKHLDAVRDLLRALTNSDRFDELQDIAREKGEEDMFTEMFDIAEEKGKREGIQEGRLEGRREGIQEGRLEGRREGIQEGRREGKRKGRQEGENRMRRRVVGNMLRSQEPLGKIMKYSGLSESKVRELAQSLNLPVRQ